MPPPQSIYDRAAVRVSRAISRTDRAKRSPRIYIYICTRAASQRERAETRVGVPSLSRPCERKHYRAPLQNSVLPVGYICMRAYVRIILSLPSARIYISLLIRLCTRAREFAQIDEPSRCAGGRVYARDCSRGMAFNYSGFASPSGRFAVFAHRVMPFRVREAGLKSGRIPCTLFP